MKKSKNPAIPKKNFLIKLIIGSISFFTLIFLGLLGYSYIKTKIFISPAQKCCLACHNQVNSENINTLEGDKQKSCLNSKELDENCKKYFEENKEEDKKCANGPVNALLPKITISNPIFPNAKEPSVKLTELKEKYGNMVWNGTVKGSVESGVEPAGWYGTSSYTIEIKDMKIDFDHPDMQEPLFSNLNQEDQRWPITGKLVYSMAPFKCVVCCNKISEPFIPSVLTKTLEGQISFGENELDFDFYVPEGKAVMLDTKCKDPTCDPDSIIPQQLDLGNLVDTSLKVRFEGNKIAILGCLGPNNKNYKCTASGSLNAINN